MPEVAVVRTGSTYPKLSPYSPSEQYPEYPFGNEVAVENNTVYFGVRQLFRTLKLDFEQFGTKDWNPLGQLIRPGMTVVIKPNFVLSQHAQGKDLYAIITHPSVLRAVADYVWIALRGQGRIVFADAPQYDCNWQELVRATKMDQVLSLYERRNGPSVDLIDLRRYWSRGKHFASLLESLPGDPQGTIKVNLGRRSALYGKAHTEKLYGASYNRDETILHHDGEIQEYEVSATVIQSDVVISVPKLKVHKKVGVTLNAKGLVGICTNKNYLVHYSITPPSNGGDQYPDGLLNPVEAALIKTERWMYDHLLAPRNRYLEYLHRSIYALHNSTTRRLGLKVKEEKRLLDAGNWHGNDSAWRMTVDLFKILFFADHQGKLQPESQRRTFSIIDGIVGGENNGPLAPDPVHAGALVAGENLLATDLVATRLMGFDPLKVRTLKYLMESTDFDFGVRSLDQISILCSDHNWACCFEDHSNRFLSFTPHPGWVGHLEI